VPIRKEYFIPEALDVGIADECKRKEATMNDEYQSYNQDNQNEQNNQSDYSGNNDYQNQSYRNDSYQSNSYQNNSYQNDSYRNDSYGNTGGNYGTGHQKKGGVGKVVAITLGLVLLAGIAAAGGYSAHEIYNKLSGANKEETVQIQENTANETENTIASAPTVVLNQASSGSIMLTDVSGVVKAVMPSVVSVTNTALYTTEGYGFWQFSQQYYGDSCGSGIIVGQNDKELLIVTNNHVIEDTVSLTVQFADDSTAEATVKGADASNDIAIISVALDDLTDETKSAIAIANLGDSDELEMGQGVIAIGNALGYGQSVTEGIVSALNRQITTDEGTTLTVLQTSAAINPGNSGGALLNANGEVIGINVAKVTEDDVEGMGYAIPISEVKDLMEEMMNWETRQKVDDDQVGYLGIQPLSVDSQSASVYGMPIGVYAYSVVEGSPAAEGGMKEKDIIVSIDRYTISDVSDLQEALSYLAGGTQVQVTVERLIEGSYQEVELTITLGFKSENAN
jgi:serine protease Do